MKLTFNLQVLFVTTFLIACVMAIVAYHQFWLLTILAVVLAINLMGAIAAVTITKLLGFPTDGGYRDPEISGELDRRSKARSSDGG